MKKIAAITLFIILACAVTAQNMFQLPLIRTGSSKDREIELNQLKITVVVVENIATTTMEMQFYNDNNRIMEGELNFPLPQGITVSRFALDVNGEMREGVVVEKEKATMAFEAVTRRVIDPGLVEVTSGNNFKARVYPIPAKGYKKALVAFEQELEEKDGAFVYHLPLNCKNELELFEVKTEVAGNKPKPVKQKKAGLNLSFSEEYNSYHANYSAKDIHLDTHLSFSVPMQKNVSEVMTYRGLRTSDNYFYIYPGIVKERRQKLTPSKLCLVWDVSSSGTSRDMNKEIAILERYMEWMNRGTIELLSFSNALHEWKHFTVQEGRCDDLIKQLLSTRFDGATNLDAIDISRITTDEILLFTDGLSNFGRSIDQAFPAPVLIVNTSARCDHNLLASLARASNGVYINAMPFTVDEAIESMTTHHKHFISADYNSRYISEFYAGNKQAGRGFSFAGIMEGAKSEIVLHFGFGNEITESRSILIDNTQRITDGTGERIWAQMKLNELLLADDMEAVKAHGKMFNLVTPGTSLIVLDRVQDYVRYEIVPPPSLLEEYNVLLGLANKDRISRRERHMSDLCRQFENDSKRWDKKPVVKQEEPHVRAEISDSRPQTETSDISSDDMEIIPEITNSAEADPMDFDTVIIEEFEFSAEVEEEQAFYVVVEDEEESVEETVFFMVESENARTSDPDNAIRPTLRDSNSEMNYELAARSQTSKLKMNRWESKATYMNDLKATDIEDLYLTYLELKGDNCENPSFYIDVATYMLQRSQRKDALRVLSNLAELEFENAEILRALGRILYEHEFYDEAIAVFEDVLKFRSFEPQSYFDLGLAWNQKGDFQKAIEYLYKVVDTDWDLEIIRRFPDIELIALHAMNEIIFRHPDLDISFIDPCFIKHIPLDIRIVIDWDANDTDIDLWVTDPNGEKCFYKNRKTRIGGVISRDVTQGYGPEEFRLKNAVPGTYAIDVDFFGTRKQSVLNKVNVRAVVYTRYGSAEENREVLSIQLEPVKKGVYRVGEIVFE